MKSFFENKDTGSGKLAVLQSLESIKANVKWLKAYRHTVVAWLQDFVSSHVHLPINNPHHPVHVTSLDERYKYGRPWISNSHSPGQGKFRRYNFVPGMLEVHQYNCLVWLKTWTSQILPSTDNKTSALRTRQRYTF